MEKNQTVFRGERSKRINFIADGKAGLTNILQQGKLMERFKRYGH